VVGARLQRLVGIIEELSFTMCGTGLLVLCYVTPKKKASAPLKACKIVLPISNQEPASQMGTVRELVSRNFSRLQSEGVLKTDGRVVDD